MKEKNKTFIVALVPFQLPNRGSDKEANQRELIMNANKNEDKQIYVEVVGSKFEINDRYITVIGNIVTKSEYLDFCKNCKKS